MEQYSAYLVCWTTHGWTDATASRLLATTLMDSNDNFTHQAVDPGIVLGPVCILQVMPPPCQLNCEAAWALYCQLESLFHDCQLPRVARYVEASCPSASWPSASSILISSWHEQKALCHGSDSALTAEMFRGSFAGLSILKLILFSRKAAVKHNNTSLVDSKFKNAMPVMEPFI